MEFVPVTAAAGPGRGAGGGGEEADQMMMMTMSKGMLPGAPFSYSSSSSSSSSHHHNNNNKTHLLHLSNGRSSRFDYNSISPQIYENHHQEAEVGAVEEDRGAAAAAGAAPEVEREHMFDKVVTPSDVGKLNRLVIPKQHAEKYFPLDSSINEKGLLLNFEDRNGKPWRFRYSYWNSSQSYVMTKGWSRFVKEKKLDAGDIVSFQRGVGESSKDRLYIDWRRRPDQVQEISSSTLIPPHHFYRSAIPWSPLLMRPPAAAYPRDHMHLTHPQQNHHLMSNSNQYYHQQQQQHPYSRNNSSYGYGYNGGGGGGGGYNYGYGNLVNHHHHQQQQQGRTGMGSVIYLQQAGGLGVGMVQQQEQQVDGGGGGGIVFESVPVVHHHHHHGKAAAAKRLRLFGVNMECPISAATDESDDCDILAHAATNTMVSETPQLSSSSHPHLQLRLYNGTPLLPPPSHPPIDKGKATASPSSSTSMSLDLDM